ncbi:hypothetical protein [Paenisporosarcina cavernae]|uniref:Portal protein n=1 Tax=Paenisporosarcina cavernae TaxID=2320858 RepID=A0A385YU47_9BACL|nr:hypothetical protein [Paenisporosarcina cavernae]AYC29647.1 hypothetical protein D3873_07000 [Paenisporosarcina cavernae]AYC30011.1 hypothetical protein D3873_09055 [Paenisporosarcina cavernae]
MEQTKDWELYEAGKRYNNRLEPNYYDTVTANLEFFNGNQWRNLKVEKLPQPVFNIIKRVITFFIASLTSSKSKLHLEPLTDTDLVDGQPSPAEIANAQIQTLFEKFKMDFKVKDALFDAAITGDACAHLYFDMSKKPYGKAFKDIKGEISFELVDGANVYFGNANNPKVEGQPYIIISGRDMVANLKDEAKRFKANQSDIDNIQSDHLYLEQSADAGKIEVEELDIEGDETGKALYIIIYRLNKEKGTIHVSKSIESSYIYKDIDTGLQGYPVAWMNWEKQKNQYHGRALCTGMLPNQIFINRMFAMVMYHLMMTAFPKAVYNADLMSSWSNEIGMAIPVSGLGGENSINNVAGYLNPGNMSNQIIQAIELAMEYTKEMLGASDAALGNVDPKNTSAIIAVQKSSSVPLENPRANLYEWIEDIGQILFDMMGTYYGQRPVVMDIEGMKQLVEFDFNQLKDMWFNIRADVGESSYWSEIAALQTLDRLLEGKYLDIIDYLDRVPDEYIPQKQELISKIQERMQQQEAMQAQQSQPMDPASLIQQLSPEEQQAFQNAPPEVQNQILSQLQTPQGQGMPM